MSHSVTLKESISTSGLHYLSCQPEPDEPRSGHGMLFIHGVCSRASEYSPIMSALSKAHPSDTFIAAYLPGHGPTPAEPFGSPAVTSFAHLLLKLLQEMNLSKVAVSGHSMGTRVMLELCYVAHRSGSPLIKGMVFLDGSHSRMRSNQTFSDDPATIGNTSMEANFRNMWTANTPPEFVEETMMHVSSRSSSYIDDLRKDAKRFDLEEYDVKVEELGKNDGVPVLVLQSTDADSKNRRRSLVSGETTGFTQLLQDKIPHAQVVIIEDAGHFLHVDQPKAVLNAFLGFYAECSR